jgi:hypothetical protein
LPSLSLAALAGILAERDESGMSRRVDHRMSISMGVARSGYLEADKPA